MKKPRFVYKDVPTDDELFEMMKEINQRPCVLEPRYEEIEHINKVNLVWNGGAWQDFMGILLANGYEVTAKCNDGVDIDITWKDKPDHVDEMVQKIEEML